MNPVQVRTSSRHRTASRQLSRLSTSRRLSLRNSWRKSNTRSKEQLEASSEADDDCEPKTVVFERSDTVLTDVTSDDVRGKVNHGHARRSGRQTFVGAMEALHARHHKKRHRC